METGAFLIKSMKSIQSSYNKNQFYFMPHPLLKNYISHYTFTFSDVSHKKTDKAIPCELVIIPDGSGCIIFEISSKGLYEMYWGPTTKPVKVKNNTLETDTRMFFIEFLPGGLFALTGIPQKELKDYKCSVYEIDKYLSTTIGNAIWSSKSIDELIRKVDKTLIQIIEQNNKINPFLKVIINRIKSSLGTIPIKVLAESEYISERHLSRIFEKEVGLTVKNFERLTRINTAIKLYKESDMKSSTYIANELGFFDQSHLIHDFKDFCGTTPNNFLKNMSDFYNEPFKY